MATGTHGLVVGLFISPAKETPMQRVLQVQAIAGQGLEGDRYATGEGSFNEGKPGSRQKSP